MLLTTPKIDLTDDLRRLVFPPLELTFRWDGERWSHVLSLSGTVVAGSVESDPDRDDPGRVVSPAYQQVACDRTDDGLRALLVGQWGRHHGSAAFLVSEQGSAVVVDADVAVRSSLPLESLACTYRVERTSGDLIGADPTAIAWSVEDPTGVLRLEAAGASERLGLAEAGRRATRVQVGRPIDPAAATQRLHYRWRFNRLLDDASQDGERG